MKIHYALRRQEAPCLNLNRSLGRQARQIFRQISREPGVNPARITSARFTDGVRKALEWMRLESGFTLENRTSLPVDFLARIFSGSIFSPHAPYGPLHRREPVTDLSGARNWLSRFIADMRQPDESNPFDFLEEPRSFYVRGPVDDLNLGLPEFPEAAFPGLSLSSGGPYYIKPVIDNLMGLQFRVIYYNFKEREETTVGRYAFDRRYPWFFSKYVYTSEERARFAFANACYLTPDQLLEQQLGLEQLADTCRTLLGLAPRYASNDLRGPTRFMLAGPARRLTVDLSLSKLEQMFLRSRFGAKEGVLPECRFNFLNLEPGSIYCTEVGRGIIPGTSADETTTITFTPEGMKRPAAVFYYLGAKGNFTQLLKRQIDAKGRIFLPVNFMPRPWDEDRAALRINPRDSQAYRFRSFLLFHPDQEIDDPALAVGNKLNGVKDGSREELAEIYQKRFQSLAARVYADVVSGKPGAFPRGFWAGWQGQLNFALCLRHLLIKLKVITFNAAGEINLDQSIINVRAFLESFSDDRSWMALLRKHRLLDGMLKTYGHSLQDALRQACPEAFRRKP